MSWSKTENRLARRREQVDKFATEVDFEGRLISQHRAECPRNVHMLGTALRVAQIQRERCLT